MPLYSNNHRNGLNGHALRNAHLRQRALERAQAAPPLAQAVVKVRAELLQLTRLECARRAGISRGAMRDLELGIHTPTRHTLRQFLSFCQKQRVDSANLQQLQELYTGPGESLGQLVARFELLAGSARTLAGRVGISPTTLWEYRRGNFPLPLALLQSLCRAVGVNPTPAQTLWHTTERQRLVDRGLPEPWAELCVWCARAGQPESHLLELGVSTTAFRRLRYLELVPWALVATAARTLAQDEDEWLSLQKLWDQSEREQRLARRGGFGALLKQLRLENGVARRELADLFGIGGKKPARVIKHIEDDGHYSAQAYPAGLAAVLTDDPLKQARLVKLWQQRRRQFHKRRRPETRVELRLARELFGLELHHMQAVLGYSSLEYQRIERGVAPLLDSAQMRILQALQLAGQRRVEELLRRRAEREAARRAWQTPASVPAMVSLLAEREGGFIPLARCLKESRVTGLWPGRLRAIARGAIVPTWPTLRRIATACGVRDLASVQEDWHERFRHQLQKRCASPLAVELRLLIGESASSLREFSPRLGFNYSVLVREFQRIDRDAPIRWYHIERILNAAQLPPMSERWREIRALWSTADTRRRHSVAVGSRPV